MSEQQQPESVPDEQPQPQPETPEPEQAEAPDDEGAGSTGDDDPQVGRRPDFVGEEGQESDE